MGYNTIYAKNNTVNITIVVQNLKIFYEMGKTLFLMIQLNIINWVKI